MKNKKTAFKICYFPGRESAYARTRTLVKGMRKAGIEVLDCSCPSKSIFRYAAGFCKFLFYKNRSDIIFVGFLGQFIVPVVKLFTRKKILFDAFLSVYQTMAFDRKSVKPSGIFAKFCRFIDCVSCRLADKIFLDTTQHIEYFVREYKLDKSKFQTLPAGSDDSVMYPRLALNTEEFIVHFHGEFQPLHGAEYIIEAASMLPDVKFQIIGYGKMYKFCSEKVKELGLKNIIFIAPVSYEKLPEYMAEASVCLGIFGNTPKAKMVVPHKVYEALAMAKPIITSDTPAAREILVNEETAVLCRPRDPESLAESIIRLRDNPELRKKIAENGYKLFKDKYAPGIVGEHILKIVNEMRMS